MGWCVHVCLFFSLLNPKSMWWCFLPEFEIWLTSSWNSGGTSFCFQRSLSRIKLKIHNSCLQTIHYHSFVQDCIGMHCPLNSLQGLALIYKKQQCSTLNTMLVLHVKAYPIITSIAMSYVAQNCMKSSLATISQHFFTDLIQSREVFVYLHSKSPSSELTWVCSFSPHGSGSQIYWPAIKIMQTDILISMNFCWVLYLFSGTNKSNSYTVF